MKILILSASPLRDKYIDALLEHKLKAKGHEVWTRKCLREGRESVLELKPDVCVVPPIRNPYSRDFCATLKRFRIGVVTRHTEPSCSWQDFKAMTPRQQNEILGAHPYNVDVELVWGPDEAQILNRRGVPYPAISIGAVVADLYQADVVKEMLMPKEAICQKYGFDPEKPIILVSSPWGFMDSAPDLHIDDIETASRDEVGRQKYIEMIGSLPFDQVLVTLHPGVDETPYREALQCPIDTELPAMDLLTSCDALIHSGSTMAIEMHLLNKPAYQYGDVNGVGWWQDGASSAISKVSPRWGNPYPHPDHIIKSGTNANLDALKDLEEGRYGDMDGRALDRAVDEIEKVTGTFRYTWPGGRDYDQPLIKRYPHTISQKGQCGICKEEFAIANIQFVKDIISTLDVNYEEAMGKLQIHGSCCPHCASRLVMKTDIPRPGSIKVT